MLLRFGGTSGCRMPSRALLGRRLHRSVDSIDRALRELVSVGIVRIEHRKVSMRSTGESPRSPLEGAAGRGTRFPRPREPVGRSRMVPCRASRERN
jgi:hypothetical protein